MKIVVTGASGFVGTNVSSYLSVHNHQVYPVSLRSNWQDDLPKENDAFFHLAGKVHDTQNALQPEEYFKINTELTKKVFKVFLDSRSTSFIYFSSVKAVADKVTSVLTEEVIPNPKTPYGESKLKAEEYILSNPLPTGKRVIIFRPCMIHGPGNKGNLNLLYQVVKKGIPWPLAAFENQRSLLSIGNLLFILELFLNNPNIPGGIYNVADDESLSTNEIIRITGEAMHVKPHFWKVAPGLMRLLAKTGDTFPFPLNSERLEKLTESYVVSNQKVKAALGIKHLPLTAEDGLKKTITDFNNKSND